MANFPERTILLVVDRKTRQVIDAGKVQYSWDLDAFFENHDLNRVDMIVRAASSTVIPKVAEPEAPIATAEESEDVQPIEGVGADYNPEDDVPF